MGFNSAFKGLKYRLPQIRFTCIYRAVSAAKTVERSSETSAQERLKFWMICGILGSHQNKYTESIVLKTVCFGTSITVMIAFLRIINI